MRLLLSPVNLQSLTQYKNKSLDPASDVAVNPIQRPIRRSAGTVDGEAVVDLEKCAADFCDTGVLSQLNNSVHLATHAVLSI